VTRILVDGVGFQDADGERIRLWQALLFHLATDGRFRTHCLDRGHAPDVPGVEYIPFPKHVGGHCPADSLLIQRVCDHLAADVFTSTGYTSPVATPMLLMLPDLAPESPGADLSRTGWMEKGTSISFAQRYLCLSRASRDELLAAYPEIPPETISVAACGVDHAVFRPPEPEPVTAFRERHGLDRPYVLLLSARSDPRHASNGRLVFDAAARMEAPALDVAWAGGDPEAAAEIQAWLPPGVRCRRVEVDVADLPAAYGGALALAYPPRRDIWGVAPLEAMACGCAVIATASAGLAETLGEAALLIDTRSVGEMRVALERLQDRDLREDLRARGLAHVRGRGWNPLAERLASELEALAVEGRAGVYDDFFAEWRRLRRIQANVDYLY
jgi:glycosyltransferase involved in cell wall biosynthesis